MQHKAMPYREGSATTCNDAERWQTQLEVMPEEKALVRQSDWSPRCWWATLGVGQAP